MLFLCSQNMQAIIEEADIVVAACGQPHMIKGSWIKPGATVIDVGTNPVPDATKKSGFRCVQILGLGHKLQSLYVL